MNRPLLRFLSALALGLALAACGKKDPHAGHDHAKTGAAAHAHEHKAPHDGTAVVLGHEAYHLELVRDAAAGKLAAYVLDGELENFIRVKAASFEVVAAGGAGKRVLTFRAMANTATGETVGDTSCFEAQADWLKTEATFDATLTALEIKGTAFTAVAFNFPNGNDRN